MQHLKIKNTLKSVIFFIQYILSLLKLFKIGKNEYGLCSICGYFSRFYYVELFNENSNEVKSCNWDREFTENINVVNTMICSHCYNKYRVRKAAQGFLSSLKGNNEKSVKKFLLKNGRKYKILETASTDGIFSNFSGYENIIKSEYFDDVPRGQYKKGIRSEDLQSLSFDDEYFDCVIALDVFEHIPEPYKAFSEVNRVLKKNGVGIITVPIDWRNQTTKTLAVIENGNAVFYKSPAYHSDPLRENGALVFTDFGLDIKSILLSKGLNVELREYSNPVKNCYQYVIILKK